MLSFFEVLVLRVFDSKSIINNMKMSHRAYLSIHFLGKKRSQYTDTLYIPVLININGKIKLLFLYLSFVLLLSSFCM